MEMILAGSRIPHILLPRLVVMAGDLFSCMGLPSSRRRVWRVQREELLAHIGSSQVAAGETRHSKTYRVKTRLWF